VGGYSGWPQAGITINHGCGGYGNYNLCYSATGSPPPIYFSGDVYARGVKLTSARSLKQDFEQISAEEGNRAFRALRPAIFRRKPAPPGEGAVLPSPVGRREWGFIADEMQEGAPDAVTLSEEGLTYSLSDVVAIVVARIKQLEEELEVLRQLNRR
jgi:hypothetical protein